MMYRSFGTLQHMKNMELAGGPVIGAKVVELAMAGVRGSADDE